MRHGGYPDVSVRARHAANERQARAWCGRTPTRSSTRSRPGVRRKRWSLPRRRRHARRHLLGCPRTRGYVPLLLRPPPVHDRHRHRHSLGSPTNEAESIAPHGSPLSSRRRRRRRPTSTLAVAETTPARAQGVAPIPVGGAAREAEHVAAGARVPRGWRDERCARWSSGGVPGRGRRARRELGRPLEGHRHGVRCRRRERVPGAVAEAHRILRRLRDGCRHERQGEAGQSRERSRRLHAGFRCLPRVGESESSEGGGGRSREDARADAEGRGGCAGDGRPEEGVRSRCARRRAT